MICSCEGQSSCREKFFPLYLECYIDLSLKSHNIRIIIIIIMKQAPRIAALGQISDRIPIKLQTFKVDECINQVAADSSLKNVNVK